MINTNALREAERYCALGIGVLFLVLGIAGFIPALVSIPGTEISFVGADHARSAYAAGFGYVFGLFPTNFLHNLVHCSVGLLGITSYITHHGARQFNRFFFVSYVVLVIMGLLPITNTFFGLMPLFGYNVILNATSALAAAYYGVVIPAKLAGEPVSDNI
ncbi:hypothetical protein NIES4071_31290 [Calothrix sp. NIES-4071]|nr:hypothetical protein NIES4071_31290 [Calothrix sp. NIES-4071]BAZ57449.1 hypothetical protein NIES4105_31230 [Calothrix sp. NIES-4105]